MHDDFSAAFWNPQMETCDVHRYRRRERRVRCGGRRKGERRERVVMLEKVRKREYGGKPLFRHGFRFWHTGPTRFAAFVPDVESRIFQELANFSFTPGGFSADLGRMTLDAWTRPGENPGG